MTSLASINPNGGFLSHGATSLSLGWNLGVPFMDWKAPKWFLVIIHGLQWFFRAMPFQLSFQDEPRTPAWYFCAYKPWRPILELQLSHSKNLQSLAMSYHVECARSYAMLTRMVLSRTRSKLRNPLREVFTRPYGSEGFAYVKKFVLTRPLLD